MPVDQIKNPADWMTKMSHRNQNAVQYISGTQRGRFSAEAPVAQRVTVFRGDRTPSMMPGYTGHVPGQQDYHIGESYGSFVTKVKQTTSDSMFSTRLPSITADPTGRGIERWIRTSGPGWRAEGAPHGMFTTTKRIGRALMNTSGNARNLPLLRRDGYQFPDKSTQLVGYQHQMACRS